MRFCSPPRRERRNRQCTVMPPTLPDITPGTIARVAHTDYCLYIGDDAGCRRGDTGTVRVTVTSRQNESGCLSRLHSSKPHKEDRMAGTDGLSTLDRRARSVHSAVAWLNCV